MEVSEKFLSAASNGHGDGNDSAASGSGGVGSKPFRAHNAKFPLDEILPYQSEIEEEDEPSSNSRSHSHETGGDVEYRARF